MGAEHSFQIDPPQQSINHFGFLFDYKNMVSLVLAPNDIVQITKETLPEYFSVREVNDKNFGYVDFKLRGSPFSPLSTKDDVLKKRMVANLLQNYYALGWHFKVAADIPHNGTNSNILIFERAARLSTTVICFSFSDPDKIRAMVPPYLLPSIRSVMKKWPFGLQKEVKNYGSYEFKLKGNPWSNPNGLESYYGVALINSLLEMLFFHGWIHVGSIQTGNYQSDLNNLYFRYDPSVAGQSGRFFGISLNDDDKMRLVNAPQELVMPIKSVIAQYCPLGILEEMFVNGALEFKINGEPWWRLSNEARKLYSGILNLLKQHQWSVYATCKLSTSTMAKTVSFFRFDPSMSMKANRSAGISLNNTNNIKVIDGDMSVVHAVYNAIISSWHGGPVKHGPQDKCWDFEIKGTPFFGNEKTIIYVVAMMVYMMSNFKSLGLQFSGLVDVSGKYRTNYDYNYPANLSSWYFHDF